MERVPAGSVPAAERWRNLVTLPRAVLVTAATFAVPTAEPLALRNVAVIPTRAFCPPSPPSQPDRLNGTPPASTAEAAEETSTVCDRSELPVAPPVKNCFARLADPGVFASG